MHNNAVKARLKAGKIVLGAICGIPSPATVELCGHAGFDFTLIDAEHGPISEETCTDMVRAAETVGMVPLVRVPDNAPKVILRFLDTGALGVMVPQVTTAEEARRAVAAVRYVPEGTRGIGPGRAFDYGQTKSTADYITDANRELLVIVQIEQMEAVEHIGEILAVPGVDVIMLGPRDLSTSMGYAGKVDQPEVQAALERVMAATRGTDKALGLVVGKPDDVRRAVDQGGRFLLANATSLITQGGRALMTALGGSR